jgi:hypothetical protein
MKLETGEMPTLKKAASESMVGGQAAVDDDMFKEMSAECCKADAQKNLWIVLWNDHDFTEGEIYRYAPHNVCDLIRQ